MCDPLSGSDGALRLALGFCNAAGNRVDGWPECVQQFSRINELAGTDKGLVVTMRATTPAGPACLVCQAVPDTYIAIRAVIDTTTAAQWSSNFSNVIRFANAPTELDRKHGFMSKQVYDVTGESVESLTGAGYKVLALLMMRAGAAMPERFKSAIVSEFEYSRDRVRKDYQMMAADGPLFVAERLLQEVQRYDAKGGSTVKMQMQMPVDVLQSGGSIFAQLSPGIDSTREWATIVTRGRLNKKDRRALGTALRIWEAVTTDGTCYLERELKELPKLFCAMKKSVAAIGITCDESPLYDLPVDLLRKVCAQLPLDFIEAFQNSQVFNLFLARMSAENMPRELWCQECVKEGISLAQLKACVRDDKLMKNFHSMVLEYRATSPSAADASHGHNLPHSESAIHQNAIQLKEEGSCAFKTSDFEAAAELYAQALAAAHSDAISISPTMAPQENQQLRMILHSNISEACLRLRDWHYAKEHAAQALKIQPRHIKSQRRLAKARQMLEDEQNAAEAQRQSSLCAEDDGRTQAGCDADLQDDRGLAGKGVAADTGANATLFYCGCKSVVEFIICFCTCILAFGPFVPIMSLTRRRDIRRQVRPQAACGTVLRWASVAFVRRPCRVSRCLPARPTDAEDKEEDQQQEEEQEEEENQQGEGERGRWADRVCVCAIRAGGARAGTGGSRAGGRRHQFVPRKNDLRVGFAYSALARSTALGSLLVHLELRLLHRLNRTY
eukprot:SAG31_NODE_2331_length_5931_cov_4.533093_2_plen_728_part_00